VPGQRIGGERVAALAALQAELADTRTALVAAARADTLTVAKPR
jgi:hypothetical protein